jgi:hypothetical protein
MQDSEQFRAKAMIKIEEYEDFKRPGLETEEKPFLSIFLLSLVGLNFFLAPVLRIRIRMFLSLPDPNPLVQGTDPYPSIINQNK